MLHFQIFLLGDALSVQMQVVCTNKQIEPELAYREIWHLLDRNVIAGSFSWFVTDNLLFVGLHKFFFSTEQQ